MSIVYKQKRYKINRAYKHKVDKLNTLETMVRRQLIIKKGMSMMYIAFNGINGERKFKTRGEHSQEVAEIGADLAKKLGGDERKAFLIGMAHDFGHSLLAHTGENALGRFLISPDEFLESDKIRPRDAFDHSKHGSRILEITCQKMGIEVPEYLINGIESHSTGSNSQGSIKCESFEAECIMRADKIASSISDTQDMIKAGVFDLSDESLSEIFDSNEMIRGLIKKRVFKDYKNNKDDLSNLYGIVLGSKNEFGSRLRALEKEKRDKANVYPILDKFVEEKTDEYIEKIKKFIKLPEKDQRERMINLIIDGIEHDGKKIDVHTEEGYSTKYPNGQLYVTQEAEAILAGLRGLLMSMESERKIGKAGAELEGLVETVARFVYKNESEFKDKWPFKNWKIDRDGKKLEWKERVAFGLAQMQDEQFKKFVLKQMDNLELKKALKCCKYRDPRDREFLKRNPDVKNLPFSTYDFSTPESIEAVWNIDINRQYQPPMYEDIGAMDGVVRSKNKDITK